MQRLIIAALACMLAGCAAHSTNHAAEPAPTQGDAPVRLGNFSVSLTVKDIAASRAFYEKLGFTMVAGDQAQNWIVLQSGSARIGLFQGMFERNMLTFNPGWDGDKNTLTDFDDVRDLQTTFKSRGLTPDPAIPAAHESSGGPTYFMLTDPDGNPILFDQHVPSPARRKN